MVQPRDHHTWMEYTVMTCLVLAILMSSFFLMGNQLGQNLAELRTDTQAHVAASALVQSGQIAVQATQADMQISPMDPADTLCSIHDSAHSCHP